ncbi:unnamed protein product [Bursaphelenchus okinawaensis]|uniref:NADH dehydrogenase [ubiquinone] 1 alpha subcomplex subunit 5 n=1 Tax=Bursaphelenchus okinawaensis TaxID=465554 RepID=A0A811KZ15_9BILA|nr:unnamed protein product [Bursaphelenchus okinawaensis]CAG9114875.1 unnamed protein product [Bursaphelenchus okinawaensis]
MSLASKVLKFSAQRSQTITPKCSMYQNPYIIEHQKRRRVSEDYPKKSTGLTGLWVNEHPHYTLKVVYGRILRTLQSIPVNNPYRQATEQLINHRLKLVEEETDVFKLEEKIGMGQIEEVIQQAEYEVAAARAIVESKAWEPLAEPASESQWRWPVA